MNSDITTDSNYNYFCDTLKNIDYEDLYFWILDIEQSYNIVIEEGDLSLKMNFGEYIDAILNKIELNHTHTNACTTQQTFYKLKNDLVIYLGIKPELITPNSCLDEIIPIKNRVSQLKAIEKTSGINFITHLASPLDDFFLLITCITSFLAIPCILICYLIKLIPFFYFLFPFSIIFICILGFKNLYKLKSNFKIQNIRGLIEYSVTKDYIKFRKEPDSYNKKESEKLLVNWFCETMDINQNELSRYSRFI